MCENTLLAMNQIVTAMDEQGPQFLNSMSRKERRAFQELFNMCEDFMSLSFTLVEAKENEGDDFPQSMEYDEGE
jgi:hypothetical protein